MNDGKGTLCYVCRMTHYLPKQEDLQQRLSPLHRQHPGLSCPPLTTPEEQLEHRYLLAFHHRQTFAHIQEASHRAGKRAGLPVSMGVGRSSTLRPLLTLGRRDGNSALPLHADHDCLQSLELRAAHKSHLRKSEGQNMENGGLLVPPLRFQG